MTLKEKIKRIIEKAISQLQTKGSLSVFDWPEIKIDCPEYDQYGDYSTNLPLLLAAPARKKPAEIALLIKEEILTNSRSLFEKIEIAGPGFINFFISDQYLQKNLDNILKEKDDFGRNRKKKKEKINLEFISANPTGPLTLGNGRGGFCGDVLANVLEKAGYPVFREYYVNDTGEQIRKLGLSILGEGEPAYRGEYIKSLRARINDKDADKAGQKAVGIILSEIIKPAVKKMGIKFDGWFSEKKLFKNKEVEKTLAYLKRKQMTYTKDSSLWFKSSYFGDDKDRVLIKSNGQPTYLASDIAYLRNKVRRGFDRLIYLWGADHHGYIKRLKAAAGAMDFDQDRVNIIIMQLVRLLEKGREVRMSKRSGLYLTIDELIDAVGLDVARFFFLTKSPPAHLNFDLDLAREQSEKNPVYYIQYAHARICRILEKAGRLPGRPTGRELKLLNHPKELALLKQLLKFPEIIEETAKDYQLQRLPQYALNLSSAFHQFYKHCQVLDKTDPGLTQARLKLVLASKIILKSSLSLMGITAPSEM